jgi:hypothetical protein
MISSGRGGLYRVRGFEPNTFSADLVLDFKSRGVAVPVVVNGRYWVQPLGGLHRVVVLDLDDPSAPRQISAVQFDDNQSPHWLAYDGNSRIVMANADEEWRLWMMRIDRNTGELSVDETFRDTGSAAPGLSFDREEWPHGRTGPAVPHGTVFSN